jgi:hypothetical protein
VKPLKFRPRFKWRGSVAAVPAYEPGALVYHRQGRRILLQHRSDETCHYCDAATRHHSKPAIFVTSPTPGRYDDSRGTGAKKDVGPEGTPFTPFSHRLMNSKSLENAISKPWKK